MAQLWGGRFEKEVTAFVNDFNASITFDNRFYHQDIQGSIAHVTMLAKQKILTDEERDLIIGGLNAIEKDLDEGKIAEEGTPNDIFGNPQCERLRSFLAKVL